MGGQVERQIDTHIPLSIQWEIDSQITRMDGLIDRKIEIPLSIQWEIDRWVEKIRRKIDDKNGLINS